MIEVCVVVLDHPSEAGWRRGLEYLRAAGRIVLERLLAACNEHAAIGEQRRGMVKARGTGRTGQAPRRGARFIDACIIGDNGTADDENAPVGKKRGGVMNASRGTGVAVDPGFGRSIVKRASRLVRTRGEAERKEQHASVGKRCQSRLGKPLCRSEIAGK